MVKITDDYAELVARLLHVYEHTRTMKTTLTNPDGPEAARAIEALVAENARLREALTEMVYEATHLSPEQDDGSHWANIGSETLARARATLEDSHD